MKVETILVPTDFSDDAQQALSTAKELAKRFGAKLVLLHAYCATLPLASPLPVPYTLPDSFYQEVRDQATAQVESAVKQLEAEGMEATGVAVPDPASLAIVAQAEQLHADLIVMGTRGLTGLKHVALGSVAERVVRTAPCPVLTVKADS